MRDLAKPDDVKLHGQPNAVSTSMAYLEDFASEKTRRCGLAAISSTLDAMQDSILTHM